MEECAEVQSDGCQHLLSFLAERGTEPFQVIYRHFVACNSPASRKRKVLALPCRAVCGLTGDSVIRGIEGLADSTFLDPNYSTVLPHCVRRKTSYCPNTFDGRVF